MAASRLSPRSRTRKQSDSNFRGELSPSRGKIRAALSPRPLQASAKQSFSWQWTQPPGEPRRRDTAGEYVPLAFSARWPARDYHHDPGPAGKAIRIFLTNCHSAEMKSRQLLACKHPLQASDEVKRCYALRKSAFISVHSRFEISNFLGAWSLGFGSFPAAAWSYWLH